MNGLLTRRFGTEYELSKIGWKAVANLFLGSLRHLRAWRKQGYRRSHCSCLHVGRSRFLDAEDADTATTGK
jgi:hypothetical protein